MLAQNNYDYDDAGNRSTNQKGSVVTTSLFNELDQLIVQSGGGKMHFRGTVDEPATVTVGGKAAGVDAVGNFDGVTDVTTGSNTVPIVATDGSGNRKTNNYQVTVTAEANQTLSYDANGNLTADGSKTYEWDAANRLAAINYNGTSNRSEFTYDGLGRRTKIVEKTGSTINGTKKFVWDGLTIAEERDGSNQVTRRHYPQGVQFVSYNPNTSAPSFYMRDHLGSVREMTDANGVIQARYDYDPWGNRNKLSGGLDADMGFTGHYYHAPSNLHLAPYRGYDSTVGRWLSRDPISEKGGLNLYAYVGSNPVAVTDPLGLEIAAYYSIQGGWLTAVDVGQRVSVTGPASSGTNNPNDVAKSNIGPIPPGTYNIYERTPGRFGPEYILDPADANPFNDAWDGGTGRGAFRIHLAFPNMSRSGSNGCVVLGSQFLNNLNDLLQNTDPGPVGTVVSGNGNGPPNIWTGPRLGTLTVTP